MSFKNKKKNKGLNELLTSLFPRRSKKYNHESTGANDHRGMANLDPRAMVGSNHVGDIIIMHCYKHILKYRSWRDQDPNCITNFGCPHPFQSTNITLGKVNTG